MSITTKTGDSGYTSLLNGERVHKSDARIDLLGSTDELTSNIGLIKSELKDVKLIGELEGIQKNLYIIMAQVADGNSGKYKLDEKDLINIEDLIHQYESMYISENKFIIPGKNKISAMLDVGRTVGRRVERRLLSIEDTFAIDELTRKYINRISDFLYAAARYVDFKEEITKKVKDYLKIGEILVSATENRTTLNLEIAKRLLEKIEKKAMEIGLPVVIAVVNEWGNIIAVHFMDGALPGSYNIAVDKAYTSASLRLTTEELGKLSQDGQPLYGINNTNNNRIVVFGGGVPLKVDGVVIGGLGISGGSAQQDTELANYGESIFREA
jgi:cob(I)alamin adenosyltransferase